MVQFRKLSEVANLRADGLRTFLCFCLATAVLVFSPFARSEAHAESAVEAIAQAKQLTDKATSFEKAGVYSRAEGLYKEALKIRERTLAPMDPRISDSLDGLAMLYDDEALFTEAESLLERAVTIDEKALGPRNPRLAEKLDHLGVVLNDEGKYQKAEFFYRRALDIREKTLRRGDFALAESYNDLATLYDDEGKYSQAETLYLKALALREANSGSEESDVAETLDNLGMLYDAEGRFTEAISLYQRAISIDTKTLGPDHPKVAAYLNDLAAAYEDQGNYLRASSLLQRALTIRERAFGLQHPEVGETLRNLGLVYEANGDSSNAESFYRQALHIREKSYGPEHRYVAESFNDLGSLYEKEGRYGEAEPLLERAVAIREKALGPAHPELAESLAHLAGVLASEQRTEDSLALYERARQTLLRVRRADASLNDAALINLLKEGNANLRDYVKLLAVIARSPLAGFDSARASTEAFVVAEQIRIGLSQLALARSAARAAIRDPRTAALANRTQQLRDRWQATTKELAEEYGRNDAQRNVDRLPRLQHEETNLGRKFEQANDELRRRFPSYADLTAPDPIDASAAAQLLDPHEALISFISLDDCLIAWLLRQGKSPIYREIDVKREELAGTIGRFRLSLLSPNRPFDVIDAHQLYSEVLGPFEENLVGVKSLLLVPDDIVLKIPFSALITSDQGDAYRVLAERYKTQTAPTSQEFEAFYPRLSWLVEQNLAISILPSATSLRALRSQPDFLSDRSSVQPTGTEPFIGVGDPLLEGNGNERGGSMLVSRGTTVIETIRGLPRLPGTRRELIADARALGANTQDSLFMEERATKPWVMKLNRDRLGRARIISFATHALIGGEISGLKEPALVLTPPARPTDQNNGLLTTDDILSLKLENNDWLILSGSSCVLLRGRQFALSLAVEC